MSTSSTKKMRVQLSSCVAFYEKKAFTFAWTIKDFSTWFSDIKDINRSPSFPSGEQESIQWNLRFKPESCEDKLFCSIFLGVSKFPGDHLNTKFKFILMDSSKSILSKTGVLKFKFVDDVGFGFSKLIKNEVLLDLIKKDDILIIKCEIEAKVRLVDEIVQPTGIDQLAPPSTIADDFTALVDSQQFGDVTVKVGERTFRVYKGILAFRSPVFAAMFEYKMREKIKNVVTIDDVEPDVFGELLRYIYTDKVRNLTTLAYQLYAVADKYDVRTLKTLCRMSILGNLSTENATEALKCADLHQDSEMKRHTLEFLCNNSGHLSAMTETGGWKELERTFPHLVTQVLKEIVKA